MLQPEILQVITDRLSYWKQSGYQIKALCPFHNERNPSFYLDIERGIWHCFGCGQGGNLVSLLEKLVPDLVHIYMYKDSNEKLKRALAFYDEMPYLMENESIVSLVEKKRKINREIMQRMNPKWGDKERISQFGDPSFLNFSNRILFPNHFHHRLSTFLGYSLNGETPKYYYPPKLKPSVPFGWDENLDNMIESKQVYITEGIFDMLSMWQVGLPALSSSGNTLTKLPAIIPSDIQIILLPDNPKVDKGGIHIGVQWALSCLIFGRWDSKLAVFPSYAYKDANDALVSGALEEQIEKLQMFPITLFLIHVAEKRLHPRLSIDFVADIIARCVPMDYALTILRWVKKKHPALTLKFHSAIFGYAEISEHSFYTQEHWRIVFLAARSIKGREILKQVFLEDEVPFLFLKR